jgi:S-DNA-T family DNA segregation ATPase FtsK/SpoIIIE
MVGHFGNGVGSGVMSDRRPSRLDLSACALLLAGLLVALCLLSHDPTGAAVYPRRAGSTNLLGPPGAALAESLWSALGVAIYVLLASWFVLVVLLFLRRRVLTWSVRLFGWVLLVPCSAAAAQLLAPHAEGAPLAGPGGTLGAWLTAWGSESLTPVGMIGLLCASSALGLVLAGSFVLGRLTRTVKRALAAACHALWPAIRWIARSVWGTKSDSACGVDATKSPSAPAENKPQAAVPHSDGDIPIHHHDATPRDHAIVRVDGPAPILLINRHGPTSDADRFADFELPSLNLLEDPQPFPYAAHDQQLRETAALLEKTFTDFNLNVRVVGINTGPVVTQYEIALETGLRVAKVTGLADDLALNLKVPSVRIVAPIPGKNTVGVEVPNEHRAVVRLKEVLLSAGKKFAKAKIPLFLGKDTEGRPLVYDLAEMPHLLIAGRTGTGKSVCMNAIILSMLMTRRPDEVKMIMIDPKMLELSEYGRIPHLMHPIVKDMKKAEAILSWAVDKMEERYDLLSRVRVRSLAGYNELAPEEIHRRLGPLDEEEKARVPDRMPYIVIFVDEMGDLMMQMRKEVEGHIIRLAQKSRAAGIHLVVATQKPTVDVITGLIKSNLPARICFQVSSRTDSRVVLDEMGADKLLGKGDMLFLQPGTSTLMRAQGTYASDQEITRVTEHLECDPCYAQELIQLQTNRDGEGGFLDSLKERDELYESAIEIVVREGRGSVSLLQRSLGIGYGRAARLIDYMAEDGIVGAYNGSNAREVLYKQEDWEQLRASAAK